MRSLLFVVTSILLACGGASSNDAKTPTVTECSQHAKPAHDKVSAAIEANRSCSADADCMTIAVQSSCFDSCSASIAKSGQAAVEQAMSAASANECKAFAEAGCRVIIPPCAPPTPPACREGKCL